ncbi:uncharacterized protein LOC111829745 [Capsella rubella]|uniref:uncharacterized protein LOC111829745 n=1 Tax=Capsella rubella TaxID=81985 RepID=UPI000CD4AB26|nr:uncharacterized protein LOC111829745 [Capsella rubella]
MSSAQDVNGSVSSGRFGMIKKVFGFFDFCLVNLSLFLNGTREILYFQTFLWLFVSYFCLLSCDFIDQDLYPTLLICCLPAIYFTPFGIIVYLLGPTLSTTLVNLLGDNNHIYTALMCFVEATVIWAITLLKSKISDYHSTTLVVLVIGLYYTTVVVAELLQIKDRGLANGLATVILFLLVKRFQFLSVPITAVIIFGKYLVCSDCCKFCRARKPRVDEAKENTRQIIIRDYMFGKYAKPHDGVSGRGGI